MPKILQVRDVPDDVHRRLKVRAAEQGRTLSELVREQLEEAAARPTMAEALARLRLDDAPALQESSADAVRASRDER